MGQWDRSCVSWQEPRLLADPFPTAPSTEQSLLGTLWRWMLGQECRQGWGCGKDALTLLSTSAHPPWRHKPRQRCPLAQLMPAKEFTRVRLNALWEGVQHLPKQGESTSDGEGTVAARRPSSAQVRPCPGQDGTGGLWRGIGVCHRTRLFCLPGTGPGADREPGLLPSGGMAPFMQSHHSKQHRHRWAGQNGRACGG